MLNLSFFAAALFSLIDDIYIALSLGYNDSSFPPSKPIPKSSFEPKKSYKYTFIHKYLQI